MTNPRYPIGCAEESQVRRMTLSADSDNAWYVNFDNGNSNNNHRNNNGYVLAVRGAPSEYQGAVTLHDLHIAYKTAAAQKCSANQMEFENHLTDNLIELRDEINGNTWQPSKSLCFIASSPKTREIHAPAFRDRVVHHWLIAHIEPVFEPGFIHDSFANRKGKGSHAAVVRLQRFVREVHSGQRDAYYLQLDIKNFFNTIHRPTLWEMLKARLIRAGMPEIVLRTAHALVRRHPLAAGVRYRATPAERAGVPAHKRLANAPAGRGLPIGNLSSQFFANVYMDALDQFFKHVLKVPRYVRYVDDLVLVHHDRDQLMEWHRRIERFLAERLRLSLKPGAQVKPLSEGIDFLGYVTFPARTRVRRRVIAHARDKLTTWQRQHVRRNAVIARPDQYRRIRSIASSYHGHFQHADSHGLQQDFEQKFRWLPIARRRFDYRLEGQQISIPIIGAAV